MKKREIKRDRRVNLIKKCAIYLKKDGRTKKTVSYWVG